MAEEEARERLGLLARAAFGPQGRSGEPTLLSGDGWQAEAWELSGAWRPGDGCVVVLGAFDGVHRGHRALITGARAQADDLGLPLVAVTFDPDPSQVVGVPQEALLSCAERRRFLSQEPLDGLVAFSFTPELAALDHRAFMAGPLLGLGPVRRVIVGEGFRLGSRGAGTVERLQADGHELGFSVVAEPLLTEGGDPVSATRVRALVDAGDVAEAAALLGRPPVVSGRVQHGRGEGASLGFPTANVVVEAGCACPTSGVYAGIVRVGDRAWPAAVNAGTPPTFTDEEASGGFLEAMLLGFEGDLYGRRVDVAFVERLRPSKPFDSVAGLQEAVRANIEQVRTLLGDERVEA